MKILVTNDDGIDSPLLRPLAEALSCIGSVTIAAPATEQSWIGKAMSRFRDVELSEVSGYGFPAYKLTGTPADCANIALGHLFPQPPDLVVSGINIGHNTGLPFVTSSGTIGGASEACLQGVLSIAASMALQPDEYLAARDSSSPLLKQIVERAAQAAAILAEFAVKLAASPEEPYGVVHSLNFPHTDLSKAEIRPAPAMRLASGSLYRREGNRFSFEYSGLRVFKEDCDADLGCIKAGHISHTILDYTRLSR